MKFPLENAAGIWKNATGVSLRADGGGSGKWDLHLQSWGQHGGMILALGGLWLRLSSSAIPFLCVNLQSRAVIQWNCEGPAGGKAQC